MCARLKKKEHLKVLLQMKINKNYEQFMSDWGKEFYIHDLGKGAC